MINSSISPVISALVFLLISSYAYGAESSEWFSKAEWAVSYWKLDWEEYREEPVNESGSEISYNGVIDDTTRYIVLNITGDAVGDFSAVRITYNSSIDLSMNILNEEYSSIYASPILFTKSLTDTTITVPREKFGRAWGNESNGTLESLRTISLHNEGLYHLKKGEKVSMAVKSVDILR